MSPLRLLRAIGLAVAALILSLAGHAFVGGGGLPALSAIVVVALVYAMLAAARSGVVSRPIPVALTVLGLQGLAHVLFVVMGPHQAHGSLAPSLQMLVGHVVAACAVAWLLVAGERIAAAWIRFFDTVFRGAFISRCGVNVRLTVQRASSFPSLLAHDVIAHLAHRGPPTFVIVT